MKKVYLYQRYERFWHWAQALLIGVLMMTGFEIHGTYRLLGFSAAARLHNVAALALIILALFTMFWHFTTGEWRQYLPQRSNLGAMVWFYMVGIFRGAPHPTNPTPVAKLNPLQRLSYLSFKILIFPVMATTGLLYLFYDAWPAIGLSGSVGGVALLHTAGAFLLLAFLIVHVYMTTTGRTVFSNIIAMFTGYKQIDVSEEQHGGGAGKRILEEA
jgi:thiosulfate reductase cytochrome b subunit